ncbi:MAG: cell surface protein SprA, partial [Salinivenus sp.]
YELGGRGFDSNSFDLDIEYDPSGQGASTTIPEVAGQQTLLQVLGLDRVDENGSPSPDNQFDFTPLTIDAEEGLLYFPYLRPFGDRILDVAEENGSRADGEPFAFRNLYRKKKSNAEKEDKQKNVYTINGEYKGESEGFYDLEAFAGLVEGSVEVTAGGQTLEEGSDYVVDYQSGTVNITNQSYLAEGRDIDISYEQNSVADLQQKTLLGARADWSVRDKYSLGATIMRLSQRSPVDKYRVGEEPIKNTIWGVNGSMDLTPQWLTTAVDALPLVQTRAESQVSVTGEFAQLRPGHTRTEAYERTIEEVEGSDRESFASDERNGISYIDDFEGFENTFSLQEQLNAWQVSAAPDSIADTAPLDEDVPGNADNQARTYWRGSFGWYQLTEQIQEQLEGKVEQRGPEEATSLLDVREVFDRDTRGTANPTLRTLDLYFDPWMRGPYNYTPDLESFVRTPTRVWGGITRRMPEGYTDFSVQNVEFVEFIVKVYPEDGDVDDDAMLYLDLGTISEDVVPNERLNTEDGLSLSFNPSELGDLSRIAGSPSQNGSIDIQDGRTEDVGLDGLVSYTGSGTYDEQLLETNFYSDFVEQADSLREAIGQLGLTEGERRRLRAEVARIQDDPSGDDYQYYENDRYFDEEDYFPRGATLQQRFTRYYAGDELNGFETQNQLAEDVSLRRGVARSPNTEDLDGTGGNVTLDNSYYQYAIPLDDLREQAETEGGPTDYVVSRVGENQDWYKIRIPVQNPTRTVGDIQDFTRIESIRLWTTGHSAPVTMRFASFELVGSQWRASQPVAEQPVDDGTIMTPGDGELRVASINNEEDPQYRAPVGAIVSRSQTSRGAQQRDQEQSLLLSIDELTPGRQRGIFKTFQGLDLLKYSNLRMYAHVHGPSNSPQVKEDIRENLRLFVRVGANETDDYYEYEQPLDPSDVPTPAGGQRLWPEENEMNLVLSALSQLKTARDQSPISTDSVYTSEDAGLPLDFAPDSTTIKIRGTPALSEVSTAVIGIRHAGETGDPALEDLELWVNELRVSGYDERAGWAANTDAEVDLADLASLRGSFQRRTDGFGELTSTLDDRETSGNTSWNARADLELGALFPEQQGWSLPVTLQMQSSLTEPRYDPERGDIEISETQQLFENLDADTLEARFGDQYPDRSSGQLREVLQDSVRRASETYNVRRTVTADFSKDGSDAWLMRQTVDATSLNFSYFERSARSPQRIVDDQWNWNGAFEYQLDFGSPRTVQPLGFLPEVPLLGLLGDVDFNYAPTSLSFNGSAERNATTRRSRLSTRESSSQPPRIASPYRENEDFTHQRRFSLQYDPFQFLSFSFDTNTRQNLDDVASRTQTNVLLSENSAVGRQVLTDVDTTAFFNDPRATLPDLPEVYETSARDSLGTTIFVEDRQQRRSEWDVFQDLVFGPARPRTNRYAQRLSTTLQVGLLDREAFNWIDVQDVSYQSSFGWQNSSEGSLTGASVNNEGVLQTGVSLQPNRVWERFGFFERMKEAQRSGGSSTPAGPEDEEEDEEEGVGWDDVPVPNPLDLLRGLALTFMDINDLTVNYDGTRTSRSSNVGDATVNDDGEVQSIDKPYRLLDALRGEGPSLGYRLGLERSISPESGRRVFPEGQRVVDNLTNEHEFEGNTTLSPSQTLEMDLNWQLDWSRSPQVSFSRPPSGSVSRARSERGRTQASVWAFGSFESFFESQLNTLQAGVGREDTLAAAQVPLTNASVTKDFQSGYLTGGGTGLASGFAPFPLPGWTVRYSGLSDWPLIGGITERISLRHGYNATYQTSFERSNVAGESTSLTIAGSDGPNTFVYRRSEYQLGSPQLQAQFSPLLGMDVTWPGDLQTSLEWGRRTTTSLRVASLRIAEKKTNEVSGQLSYSAQGFSIPFLPLGRIENRVELSVTLTRQVEDEREYSLRPALEQANAAGDDFDVGQVREGDNVSIISETERLALSPQISYSVSDRVTADFTLEYEKFNGDSRQPSYTNVNGSFNVRVNISQN